jgi:hypothetical protein
MRFEAAKGTRMTRCHTRALPQFPSDFGPRGRVQLVHQCGERLRDSRDFIGTAAASRTHLLPNGGFGGAGVAAGHSFLADEVTITSPWEIRGGPLPHPQIFAGSREITGSMTLTEGFEAVQAFIGQRVVARPFSHGDAPQYWSVSNQIDRCRRFEELEAVRKSMYSETRNPQAGNARISIMRALYEGGDGAVRVGRHWPGIRIDEPAEGTLCTHGVPTGLA